VQSVLDLLAYSSSEGGNRCRHRSHTCPHVEVVLSIATIYRALDLAISLLDTADMYGVGRNEELAGRAIRGRHVQRVQACLAHGRAVFAGVYPALAAGDDTIWRNGALPTGDVTIAGGEVSEVDRRHGYLIPMPR
jgi:hypothetical protein